MTFVRGSNPIWFEVDLTAHAFDDTFYLFILNNEIPYIPATTWQDPYGNVEWMNPIQFNANGTLPNNIYYDPDTVYRLEFRQGPTQSDPLIYLVENYVPGISGDIPPVPEAAFSTNNQITNPQFSILNFVSPLTLTSVGSQSINFAPGWFLNLTGSGNVTITQVLLNSTVVDDTNASYAIRIQLSGSWTKAYLSQRFSNNGVLWSNIFVSSSITALSGLAGAQISAILVDSLGNDLGTVLDNTILTQVFNTFPGFAMIDSSINTQFPAPSIPSAYIEYQLSIPINCDITITSLQLIAGDDGIEYPYEQTTLERQLDQTFHYYQPKLSFKPIPSLLTAWDFPLNPAQLGSSTTMTTAPAYIWDQTIAASAVANMNVVRGSVPKGPLAVVSTGNNDAFYLMQYLTDGQALETALSRLSVNINAYATATNVTAQVYLFNGNNSSAIPLLSIGTIGNLTLLAGNWVFSLTAPNWVAIPQTSGFSSSAPLLTASSDLGFSQWDPSAFYGATGNFAIVVVFNVPTTGTTIICNSISCIPGDIPTRPAPQTLDEVLRECQFYYTKSFPPGTKPVQNSGAIGTYESYGRIDSISGTNGTGRIVVRFPSPLRTIPTGLVTAYNPAAANAFIYNETLAASFTIATAFSNLSVYGFIASSTLSTVSGAAVGQLIGVNWSADARLGII